LTSFAADSSFVGAFNARNFIYFFVFSFLLFLQKLLSLSVANPCPTGIVSRITPQRILRAFAPLVFLFELNFRSQRGFIVRLSPHRTLFEELSVSPGVLSSLFLTQDFPLSPSGVTAPPFGGFPTDWIAFAPLE